jgi:methionyl aminopeptidase
VRAPAVPYAVGGGDMSIGSTADWKGLREAGRVVRETLDVLEKMARPGVSTADLDRAAARIFSASGARSAPALVYGFPGTVLISVNDEIVHGVPGARRLRAGDVVKIDVTVEKDGYVADAARTVVLEGGSETAVGLKDCAEAAFARAMDAVRADRPVSDVSRAIEQEVVRRGFSVIDGLCGHGVGRTIHEPPTVPNRFMRSQRDRLTEGLVIAIEPMICSGSGKIAEAADGWTIRTADGSLAAHYEHTVVVTRARPVLLTASGW